MKTTATCPVCQQTFTRIHTVYKQPRFCSRACANKAPGRMTAAVRSRIGRSGPEHPGFKGGWKARGGNAGGQEYFFTWVPPVERANNPTTNKRGYIHRSHYVWNKAHPDDLVQPGQVVHHLNGKALDDRPENLRKMKTQREHWKHHAAELTPTRQRNKLGRFK